MFFLLNDVVLNLEATCMSPPVASQRFKSLTLGFVEKLGRELFAEEPLLHRDHLERARRIASLILLKQPEINAALFIAPARGCHENLVAVRYAQISFEIMGRLYERQQHGVLTTVEADRQVWRRLAA